MRRRITIENRDAVILALQQGTSHVELARLLNTTPSNITSIAKRMRAKGVAIPESRMGRAIRRAEEIRRLRVLGHTHDEIIRETGVSRSSVKRMIAAAPSSGGKETGAGERT